MPGRPHRGPRPLRAPKLVARYSLVRVVRRPFLRPVFFISLKCRESAGCAPRKRQVRAVEVTLKRRARAAQVSMRCR